MPESVIAPDQQKSARRLLVVLSLTKLGDVILNPKVTLPWVFQFLGVPHFFLAMLVPIREAGSMLPQLFISRWVQATSQRKPLWQFSALAQGLCLITMAVVCFVLEGTAAGIALIALLALTALLRSMTSLTIKDLMGKTVAKQQRGQLTGNSDSIAGAMAVMAALLLWLDIANASLGFYVGGFILTAILWWCAAVVMQALSESPSEAHSPIAKRSAPHRIRTALQHPPFRQFLIVRSLLISSGLSAPFYVVLAYEHSGDGLSALATFVLAHALASLCSGIVWGRWCDYSCKQVLMASALLTTLCGGTCALLAGFFPASLDQVWLLPSLYFGLAIAHQGIRTGRSTYIINMAEGNQRTEFVAVGNTLMAILLLLSIGFGSIAEIWSTSALLTVLATMSLSAACLTRQLKD